MRILAIETSCDETACALVEDTTEGLVRILSETVASSQEIHTKTGGIVPEVAGREQIKAMVPVVEQTIIKAAEISVEEPTYKEKIINWAKENIDAVAVTIGPGLIGSLLVGTESAKTLALAWDKPLVAVNHLHGHIYANFIDVSTKSQAPNHKDQHQLVQNMQTQSQNGQIVKRAPEFPIVGLTVSGGHTDLVLMKNHGEIELVGSTRDDAAGECLDKCARLLGLPYPGGPNIALQAMKHQITSTKSQIKINKLPKPLIDEGYDFSFSGLKVAVQREFTQKIQSSEFQGQKTERDNIVSEIAYELQEAVVEILVTKTMRAVEEFGPNSVFLSGGVAANTLLRERLRTRCQELNIPFFVPEIKYCTDNAAMIGAAAIFEYREAKIMDVRPNPGLEMTNI